MLIWDGWGLLVLPVAWICLILTELSVEAVTRDDRYYQNHGWPKLAALLLAAAMVWLLGRWLNCKQIERELVDLKTGERVVLRSGGGHSLFFVPMEYWALLFVAFGIVMFFE